MPSGPKTDKEAIHKIFLLLKSNGDIILDKEHLWDGCDTPPLDAAIQLPPISIRKLAELAASRNLDWPELGEAEKLEILLAELKDSADIIQNAIVQIKATAKN